MRDTMCLKIRVQTVQILNKKQRWTKGRDLPKSMLVLLHNIVYLKCFLCRPPICILLFTLKFAVTNFRLPFEEKSVNQMGENVLNSKSLWK